MTGSSLSLLASIALAGCASGGASSASVSQAGSAGPDLSKPLITAPQPDMRVGLKAGLQDAGEAIWNLKMVSHTPAPQGFAGITNSDLAFHGTDVIQGNYNGFQIWDISDPSHPQLRDATLCPASQSDVSVYNNLLFVSAEAPTARLDCGSNAPREAVSKERIRGLRIFDITDISHPKYLANVQTCRGSHTHTVLVDPKDPDNVYVYISGSSRVRSPNELPGCSSATPDQDPNSALFRIEVIKVPLAHPEQAAIVSSPRIFNDLTKPARHGESEVDKAESAKEVAEAKAKGGFTATIFGEEQVLPARFVQPMLDSAVKARGGTGAPTAADSAAVRAAIPAMIAKMIGPPPANPNAGPTQCHDITVYPAIGLAGGACEGYGLLLDISDPTHPKRLDAASDSNFSYWHSATFNNDGTKVLFSDEWGGGGQPKCRVTDKHEWGADALFTIEGDKLKFHSYYKMPAPQTKFENCVAHNGSLVPIPGRDVMIQSWYQGGISLFDWTDIDHPREIAFFDRGPVDSTRMASGGTWSVYWYNGVMVSSEISRGLDIVELTPSAFISQNEIDAAKSVKWDYLNTQGQRKIVWPPSFALSGAYLDQLERSHGLAADKIAADRAALAGAQKASGAARRDALAKLASQLDADASGSSDAARVQKLAESVKALASTE